MIPQTNTKKYTQKQCVVQHLKIRRELEFGNFKFYGEGGVREEENKNQKFFLGGFTLFRRYA